MSKSKRRPDNIEGTGGTCSGARDKRDLLAREVPKPVKLSVLGTKLFTSLVDTVSFINDQSVHTAPKLRIHPESPERVGKGHLRRDIHELGTLLCLLPHCGVTGVVLID
jgi:hypothetical protein